MSADYRVPGNNEAIAVLEESLARARKGMTSCVAVLIGDEPGQFTAYSGGEAMLMREMPNALKSMAGMVEAQNLNHTLPERDSTLGADHVCCNLGMAPLSFDFLHWLVDAEMTRVREGAPAPLKVAFWCGRDGKIGLATPARRRMFDNVIRPMLPLLGAVETENSGGRFKELFGLRDVTAAARAGEAVPRFRSGLAADASGYVTITLRESTYWPHRNSNLSAWLRLGDHIKAQGETVVYVRETAKAHEPLPGGDLICPQASVDLRARVALYENAKINLMMANGPFSLALFMDRPWLAFSEPTPQGHPYYPCTPAFWRDSMGIEQGSQYPWQTPDQRFVWATDDYEHLIEAWESRSD